MMVYFYKFGAEIKLQHNRLYKLFILDVKTDALLGLLDSE